MIDRYYTQLFAADVNGMKGNDMYLNYILLIFIDISICIQIQYV